MKKLISNNAKYLSAYMLKTFSVCSVWFKL